MEVGISHGANATSVKLPKLPAGRQTCPASVCREVVGVSCLQALLHLLKEIFDLILDLLLESCAYLKKKDIYEDQQAGM